MKSNRLRFSLLTGFLVALLSGPALAAEKSIEVIMTWTGEGTIHSIGTDKVLFMGEFEGIMYTESTEGELDAAFANCRANQHINVKTKKTEASGYCNVAVSGEDTVFAKWTCSGELGVCKGKFTLTGGTGKFKGVTGSSDLTIRSVISHVAAGMSSGSLHRTASGLAILPKLTYKLAAGN